MHIRRYKIRALTVILALAGGFTGPVSLVDQAVDQGYSRHIVEHLPVYDVEAIVGTATPSSLACRPSPTVVSC